MEVIISDQVEVKENSSVQEQAEDNTDDANNDDDNASNNTIGYETVEFQYVIEELRISQGNKSATYHARQITMYVKSSIERDYEMYKVPNVNKVCETIDGK